MRKIKFRGLRHLDNGKTEWVYGFYVERWNNKRCICQYNPKEIPSKPNEYEDNWDIFVDVYEDSIGQFTGMYDKENKPIYEGDIVEAWSQGKKAVGEVKCLKDGEWIIYPAWQNGEFYRFAPDEKGKDNVLVIGNIYDKPIEE